MEETNRVKLNICGFDFVIHSDDSEEYMRRIGALVEERIRKLMDSSLSMSTSMAAIFAALEFGDEATKAGAAADNLRSQIREYLEEASREKSEAAELRKRVISLTRQLEALQAKGGGAAQGGTSQGGSPMAGIR